MLALSTSRGTPSVLGQGSRALVVGGIALALVAGAGWLLDRVAPGDRAAAVTSFSDGSALSADLLLAGVSRAQPGRDPSEQQVVAAAPAASKSGNATSENLVPAAEPVVAGRLGVGDSGVGTDVANHELVGRATTFRAGARAVFWTLVEGGGPGDVIRHVWLQDGAQVASVTLPVGSPSWRTQSRVRLGSRAPADWVVEARDEAGRVLARQAFRVEPS